MILRFFSSLVTGKEKEATASSFSQRGVPGAQQVVTGDGRAGREHQPVRLGIFDLVAAVRPDERRI